VTSRSTPTGTTRGNSRRATGSGTRHSRAASTAAASAIAMPASCHQAIGASEKAHSAPRPAQATSNPAKAGVGLTCAALPP
jgi:hypothetical protein